MSAPEVPVARTPLSDHPYTVDAISQMLGLSRHQVLGLVELGFVHPRRGPRREYRFTFRDVVLMRAACGLRDARVPARRLLRALRRLRARLPAHLPLSGLRIQAVHGELAVRDARQVWTAGEGQLLLDFEVGSGPAGSLSFLPVPAAGAPADTIARNTSGSPTGPPTGSAAAPTAGPAAMAADSAGGNAPAPCDDADARFETAETLEESDPVAAESAYRAVLDLDPGHLSAHLNLVALLCEAGRYDEAIAQARQAVARLPDEALIRFNLGVALEDGGHAEEALVSYRRTLELAPEFADAHFNTARLYEQTGRAREALRHYAAYRRLR